MGHSMDIWTAAVLIPLWCHLLPVSALHSQKRSQRVTLQFLYFTTQNGFFAYYRLFYVKSLRNRMRRQFYDCNCVIFSSQFKDQQWSLTSILLDWFLLQCMSEIICWKWCILPEKTTKSSMTCWHKNITPGVKTHCISRYQKIYSTYQCVFDLVFYFTLHRICDHFSHMICDWWIIYHRTFLLGSCKFESCLI